jgi:exosome complex RNA-binding protein Rrp4
MSVKIIVAATLAMAIVTPALAAEFYIVQDSGTKRCTIMDKRPTVQTQVVVGENGKVYATREEADIAMKTVKVCEK